MLPARPIRPLLMALAITALFMLAEVVGGLLTGSLALLADAGHMFVDVGALALALVAQRMAQRPASSHRSYGFSRIEVLAALVNGLLLWVLAGFIAFEAVGRFSAPPEVRSLPMLAVAAAGLLANVATAAILMRSAHENMNVRAAFLHVVGDGLGSVGVIAAGLLMLFFGWYVADPLLSIFITVLFLYTSSRIVLQALHVLLEGTPTDVDIEKVEETLRRSEGVQSVHDLHVWTLTSGFNVMSAHVVLAGPSDAQTREDLLIRLHRTVEERFPIQHTTIQIEETTVQCQEGHMPPCQSHHHH